MTYRLDVDSELRFEVEYGAEVQLEVSIFVLFCHYTKVWGSGERYVALWFTLHCPRQILLPKPLSFLREFRPEGSMRIEGAIVGQGQCCMNQGAVNLTVAQNEQFMFSFVISSSEM